MVADRVGQMSEIDTVEGGLSPPSPTPASLTTRRLARLDREPFGKSSRRHERRHRGEPGECCSVDALQLRRQGRCQREGGEGAPAHAVRQAAPNYGAHRTSRRAGCVQTTTGARAACTPRKHGRRE